MPKVREFLVIRTLTSEECPWLDDDVVTVGTIVYETVDQFGCCGPGGVFVRYEGMLCPTELPSSALLECPESNSAFSTLGLN
jgi:hypothetical protein